MPPRNNPLPTAVRLFKCTICSKDYSRQIEYENHLRSYDHNHRQRLADMKKLTASNDTEASKPKQGLEMRTIDVDNANKKPGVGSRFTKIGGGSAAGAGVNKFKKVGVANIPVDSVEQVPVPAAMPGVQMDIKHEEDADMAESDEEEDITWEDCSELCWFLKHPVSDLIPCLTISEGSGQWYHTDRDVFILFDDMSTWVAEFYAPVVGSLSEPPSIGVVQVPA
ncbi:hypothetical protein A1F94_009964 [Pyrenophora tritici-repentis]|nr:hypothetical protein A1F94_009964 [Pyrenophora tritici-repentis]PZC93470.1 hypothetical protein A1F95_07270 [Pyrenophora tritici-repentis]PZD34369.1 hypothetical protein A1F96_01627 [Pyrenophora tritici-repentis]PZD38764.1 hypothetical protein A1F97_06465 [Pyrenophora tritici-repentis]